MRDLLNLLRELQNSGIRAFWFYNKRFTFSEKCCSKKHSALSVDRCGRSWNCMAILHTTENKKMGSFRCSFSLSSLFAYKKTPTIVIYSHVALHSFIVSFFCIFVMGLDYKDTMRLGFCVFFLLSHQRPLERRMYWVIHKTDMKIWAGQKFGQHMLHCQMIASYVQIIKLWFQIYKF